MQIDTEVRGELSCEIHADDTASQYTGILRYKVFEIGHITASDIGHLHAQFRAICRMTDTGAMVRHGIILTGYHNRDFKGDVLLVDGEFIGEWASDEFEWCHFTAFGSTEVTLSAPSPWMLHDAIAEWKEPDDLSGQATCSD